MAVLTGLLSLLKRDSGQEQRPEASPRGAQYYQHDLPPYADLVRRNQVWSFTEASAVAGLIASAYPAAGAGDCQVALYNNEQEGSGKSYIILAVAGVQIANAGALNSWGILYGVSQAKQTTLPTANLVAADIRPMRGNGGAYNGKALIDLAPTLNVDPLYKPLGGYAGATVVSLGGTQVFIPTKGLIVLPPSSLLALAVVASAVDITTRLSVTWAEVFLEL